MSGFHLLSDKLKKLCAVKQENLLCFTAFWRAAIHNYFLRITYRGCYRMTKAGRFIPSSPCLLKWGIIWNGVCITANISESRSSADGCILSDILTDEVPEKYFLSDTALRKLLNNLSGDRKANAYMKRTE